MTASPPSLFVGFHDPEAPVICLAGPDVRADIRNARKLFAILRGCEAPEPLRSRVHVVSASASSAAVFVPGDTEDNFVRYARMARTMGEDLVGDEPSVRLERWDATKPILSFGAVPMHPVPSTYYQNRFGSVQDISEIKPYLWARALRAIDRGERALEVLRDACVTSTDANDHYELGELLLIKFRRPQEGVPHLRRACELAPDVEAPFTTLGLALRFAGDKRGAWRAASRAATLAPDDAGVWANLALVCEEIGDKEGMRRAAERAQELEPGEPFTAVLLAGGSSALE